MAGRRRLNGPAFEWGVEEGSYFCLVALVTFQMGCKALHSQQVAAPAKTGDRAQADGRDERDVAE